MPLALLIRKFCFQNQLLELKSTNYTLQSQLNKTLNENSTLRLENEQLKEAKLPEQNSIKHKLNPFTLAKNIANKVERSSPAAAAAANHKNEQLAHQLQSQENEFVKTNEMLRSEIALLQTKIGELENSTTNSTPIVASDPVETSQTANFQKHDDLVKRLRRVLLNEEAVSTPVNNNDDGGDDYRQLFRKLFNFELELNSSTKDLYQVIESYFGDSELSPVEAEDAEWIEKVIVRLCDTQRVKIARLIQLASILGANLITQHKSTIGLTGEVEFIKQLNTTFAEELEQNNAGFEKQLAELRVVNETIRVDLASKCQELETEVEKLAESTEANRKLEKIKCDYEQQLVVAGAQLEASQSQISSLQSKLTESINERKISEKRGFKIIKELKKQLNSEKSRAEKMLSLLKNESIDSKCELPTAQSSDALDKCSSSDSWSYMNESAFASKKQESVHSEFSDIEMFDSPKPAATAAATTLSELELVDCNQNKKKPQLSSPSTLGLVNLEQENVQLVTRISQLQQEKWRLEEQVNQLEHEIGRLTGELAEKNQLISHYCIEGRASAATSPEKTTTTTFRPPLNSINNSVLKVVTFLKDGTGGGGDSSKSMLDVNRKLQRMVEEVLTKNMHLQNNLEAMSNELMAVKRKLAQPQ